VTREYACREFWFQREECLPNRASIQNTGNKMHCRARDHFHVRFAVTKDMAEVTQFPNQNNNAKARDLYELGRDLGSYVLIL
jgi:hypothetical protein